MRDIYLSEALAVPRGVTAFVGAGGKSTLIDMLGRELSRDGKVLVCTTTHILPPKYTTLISPTAEEILKAFETTNLIAVGSPAGDGKLGALPEILPIMQKLASFVLVEADGAHRKPIKAPAEHEPVIPQEAELVVAIIGMDSVGKTIAEAAHRPQICAALLGKNVSDSILPEDIAALLGNEHGQRKNVKCRFVAVLNKADTPERLTAARAAAGFSGEDIFITALENREPFLEHWRNGKCL